jgi:hypothetical protein
MNKKQKTSLNNVIKDDSSDDEFENEDVWK